VKRLEDAGITAWVDGGWGVDALLGRQTRPHEDLDLVIDAAAADSFVDGLVADGFVIVRDWRPTAIALRHPDGREIDLHPVRLTADGGGDQVQLDGVTKWHYDAPVEGVIDRRPVRCCSVETQIEAHLGYEPDDDDRHDMALLHAAFHVELPKPYRLVRFRPTT
jgi:lincosamide nucleotidyltransferase A/C/D/E